MENKQTKIIIATHKPDKVCNNDAYLYVQVGKSRSNFDFGFQGDDTGDNISEKNSSYCELTAMYWGWKNLKNIDYIGLCHYRRFFSFFQHGIPFCHYIVVPSVSIKRMNIQLPELDKLFRKHDVVLSKRRLYEVSIYREYCCYHCSDDFRILEQVIIEKYPDYKNTIRQVFHNSIRMSPYNMFLMKWSFFDDYCSWLFDILGEMEKRIDITNYNSTQKRIWGYMGERLLYLYVQHHKMRIKYVPVYWVTDEVKVPSFFRRLITFLRSYISYFVWKSWR